MSASAFPSQLVVTVDDLGYATERDKGIIEAFEEGIVSQASLLVNGLSVDSAIVAAASAKKKKNDYHYHQWPGIEPLDKSMLPSQFFFKHYQFTDHPDYILPLNPCSSEKLIFPIKHVERSGLPLGLHFNITEGKCSFLSEGTLTDTITHLPIRPWKDTFLGKEGLWKFANPAPSNNHSLQHDYTDKLQPFKIYVGYELLAQLDQFVLKTGFLPTHVDGHNHIHILPTVAQILSLLLPIFHIRWIRCPIDSHVLNQTDLFQSLSAPQQSFFRDITDLAQYAKEMWASNLRTSNYFLGCCLMGKRNSFELATESIKQLLQIDKKSIPSSSSSSPTASSSASSSTTAALSLEIMIHAGYASKTGDDFSQSTEREYELQIITDSRWPDWLIKHNVEIKPFVHLN